MKLSSMLLISSLLLSVPIIPILLPGLALTQEQQISNLLIQGKAQAEVGNFEEAIQTLNQVVESEPKLAEAYTIRAYSYLGLQDTDSAITDFQKAAELHAS